MAIHSRLNRISDEIQQIIVVLLHTKVRDPRLKWASITSVEVSKDLRYARVFFSALDLKAEINDTLKAFEAAAGFFRTQMSKQLHLRTVPMLRFFYDDSLAYGDKMDQLIYKARVEDNAMIQQEDEAQHENISTVKFQKRERLR